MTKSLLQSCSNVVVLGVDSLATYPIFNVSTCLMHVLEQSRFHDCWLILTCCRRRDLSQNVEPVTVNDIHSAMFERSLVRWPDDHDIPPPPAHQENTPALSHVTGNVGIFASERRYRSFPDIVHWEQTCRFASALLPESFMLISACCDFVPRPTQQECIMSNDGQLPTRNGTKKKKSLVLNAFVESCKARTI